MGNISIPASDIMIDYYINHFRKEILIVHFKHGTSYVVDVLRQRPEWIYGRREIDAKGVDEELSFKKLQVFHDRYKGYTKFITMRDVDTSFVSGFCYEMRTGLSSFIVDSSQTKSEYSEMLKGFVELAGGPKQMIDRWMKTTIKSNGTFMSVFYANVYPDVANNIVEEIDYIIPIHQLKKFFEDRDLEVPDKVANETDKMIQETTMEVFKEIGVIDYLKFSCPLQYEYKAKLSQKPLYDTI